MSIVELKSSLIDWAMLISVVLLLTRLLLVEAVHVVECCKECKRRVARHH